MKGNIQLCKADLCVKAEGDYAKVLLVAAILICVVIGTVIYLKK